MTTESWKVSDCFWSKVEPLIPKVKRDKIKAYQRRKGGGRKPMASRQIFEAIVYVLRTGIHMESTTERIWQFEQYSPLFSKVGKRRFFSEIMEKRACRIR